MHLEKLATLLKAFDEPRLKRLKEYVSSPYFHYAPVCAALLERLMPLHPKFEEKKMKPKLIGKKHHTICSRSKQYQAGSRLIKAIEQFIAQEEWQKNEAEVTHYQLKGFKALQLFDEFDKASEKEMQRLTQCPEQNIETFFGRHHLTELTLSGFNARLKRSVQNNIMPIIKTLDEAAALKKLRLLCEAISRKQVLGACYNEESLAEVFKTLEPYNNVRYPYAYLFINACHMLLATDYEDSDLYYQLIKQYALQHGPTPTVHEAMGYAINHCLYWNNLGYNNAGSEYLWWIDWRMRNRLLFDKGKLVPVTFRNIIIAAQGQKKTEIIIAAIKNYAPYLPAEHYETNYAFANGLYHYNLKQYKKAIRYFLRAQAKEDIVFNAIIRRWHWMCLYECDSTDTDMLSNQLSSFEKYLERNQNGLSHLSAAFEPFIKYAANLIEPSNREIPGSTLTGLQNHEQFPGKQWLAEQLAAQNKKPVRTTHG